MYCKVISWFLLSLLFVERLYLQPLYSLISDCDETFNYWEPLNVLVRGFGKQTWEYSPEYSIRSWAFLLPFYTILKPLGTILAKNNVPAYALFYVTRGLLGLTSSVLEWSLFNELEQCLSLQTANIWLFFQTLNPGWFHASEELLPSSFGMLMYLGSTKYCLRYLSTDSTKAFIISLLFNFIGGILGWPFVLILSVPLVLHYIFTHRVTATIRTGTLSLLVLAVVTVIVFSIDSIFYGKFSPVAWNIVMYNVIGANENSGPDIFGIEPWYYYVLNLLLNFPLPVLIFSVIGLLHLQLWPVWGSLAVWMGIFFSQPHKEERFLYPIYSTLTLSASVGLVNCLKKLPRWKSLLQLTKFGVIALVSIQSSMRILALINNYTAPLTVYSELPVSDDIVNVCTGREWFHFPASFFLPDNYRLKFVQSGFDGLLPGDFLETGSLFENIRAIPSGMNNENKFDPGKLTSVDQCGYYVDFLVPSDYSKDSLDPINIGVEWEKVYCTPFVDAPHSRFFGRAFQIPNGLIEYIPRQLQNIWNTVYGVEFTEYCLFERKREVV